MAPWTRGRPCAGCAPPFRAWGSAASAGSATFTPALVHADLAPEHLLADPVTTRLTGVIDFEDAQIGDPAIDFAGLRPEVWMAWANDRGPADPGYRHRAAFYPSLAPLHRMIYGAESGRLTHIRKGLADWRRRFR
jgi:aminoglycoside phosphotransferase (APT) family kinase protein